VAFLFARDLKSRKFDWFFKYKPTQNEDTRVELLTDPVQRLDSQEVADQRRFEAIDWRFASIEGELKETSRILTGVAQVVSSLVINHQAAYVERLEKIRRLEEKVYGQASQAIDSYA
jgi:hypothetical protein